MHLSIFTLVFALLGHITTSSKDMISDNLDLTFDCGYVTFRDLDVRKAALVAKEYFLKGVTFPILYSGPFYDNNLNYYIWPMMTDGRIYNTKIKRLNFYLVLNLSKSGDEAIVDVLAKLSNNQRTKCKRKFNLLLRNSDNQVPETNGFNCGYDFFEDELILKNAKGAHQLIGKGLRYPTRFKGENLYKHEFNYWIWPISKAETITPSKKSNKNTFFIIITPDGNLVDVVAELKQTSYFIKCQRGSFLSKTLSTPDDLLDFSTESGYQCGSKFFEIKYIKNCINSSIRPLKSQVNRKYPQKISDSIFKEDVWIWPIFPDYKIFMGGNISKYFLVMNTNFKLLSVVIKDSKGMQECYERNRDLEIVLPETDDFVCDRVVFTIEWLQKTAQHACERFVVNNTKYPVPYEGPPFDVLGPYYTFPLIIGEMFMTAPGYYRIVINSECVFAGALVFVKKKLVKCSRKSDGSIPGGYSNEPIFELPNKKN